MRKAGSKTLNMKCDKWQLTLLVARQLRKVDVLRARESHNLGTRWDVFFKLKEIKTNVWTGIKNCIKEGNCCCEGPSQPSEENKTDLQSPRCRFTLRCKRRYCITYRRTVQQIQGGRHDWRGSSTKPWGTSRIMALSAFWVAGFTYITASSVSNLRSLQREAEKLTEQVFCFLFRFVSEWDEVEGSATVIVRSNMRSDDKFQSRTGGTQAALLLNSHKHSTHKHTHTDQKYI